MKVLEVEATNMGVQLQQLTVTGVKMAYIGYMQSIYLSTKSIKQEYIYIYGLREILQETIDFPSKYGAFL